MHVKHRLLALALAALVTLPAAPALAASASEIDQKATAALQKLYATTPEAKAVAQKAKGNLVFPSIAKGGFIVGGQFGDGALRVSGKTVSYYRSVAASYGLQAGVQSFGYVLMFMDDESLAYLGQSDGWEIGSGPSVVIVDKGAAKTLSTTTLQSGV
jgi:lipid-binding SYLF domain-containing protein